MSAADVKLAEVLAVVEEIRSKAEDYEGDISQRKVLRWLHEIETAAK